MSSTVKTLKVSYDPINDTNTFRGGDLVSGRVELEVTKQCEVNSLFIKFKGKAEVLWTERHGQTTVVYHSKNKYFSVKHYFIREKSDNSTDNEGLLLNINGDTYSSVVAPGVHVYPFSFQVPVGNFPSSFQGLYKTGKIVYLLETRLSRSMRIDKKDTVYINFVTQPNMSNIPELMVPQHETKDKKLKFFNSGTVAMDVNIERMGFYQGEGLQILAYIQNNSSREIKPKFCIYRKHSFFAKGKRRLHTEDLFKEVGKPIPPSSSEKVTQVIVIPRDLEPSILNCDIIKAEHRLRVYLDVKYASDPEIKFPIVILPAPQFPNEAPPAAAAGFGFEAYGNPNPPLWGAEPQQQPLPSAASHYEDAPPPYAAFQQYPTFK